MKQELEENRINQSFLDSNKRFEAKLASKRREAIAMVNQVREHIFNQTGIELPQTKKEFICLCETSSECASVYEYFENTINFFYTIIGSGSTLANYEQRGSDFKTFTVAHMYSKNRLCPVWNWRKSQLIRKKYTEYLRETKLWENYHPVHIVLTVPHTKNGYKNQKFYGQELLSKFNTLRKYPFFKKYVYAGELVLETKKSKNNNGLHIHIHSFALLHKGVSVNNFREELKKHWEKLTGANQIHCETLYFYKKNEAGQYITEKRKVIYPEPVEAADLMYEIEEVEEIREVRKKIYVDSEIREISKDKSLTDIEREEKIMNTFLQGVLECIKYHFKQDAFFANNSKTEYDVFLISEILEKTKRKRMYARYLAFYKEKKLNFDNLYNEDEVIIDEVLASAEADTEPDTTNDDNIIPTSAVCRSPYTGKLVPLDQVRLVIFRPEKRRYKSRYAANPYEPEKTDINEIMFIDETDVKKAISEIMIGKRPPLRRK
jgi:hypothetical protein